VSAQVLDWRADMIKVEVVMERFGHTWEVLHEAGAS
jgi:hypothetical protein